MVKWGGRERKREKVESGGEKKLRGEMREREEERGKRCKWERGKKREGRRKRQRDLHRGRQGGREGNWKISDGKCLVEGLEWWRKW